ncbi:YfiM family protein [Chitinophagaceae bacterium LB-8]|uniref:YfiM family protein n=1 Tax=Paraflavisolibacter caeni TaxID=2982496 RepID=A0A9X2XWV4_9BACT|nr:DUF2279 domain-containing protein [Paraflavisolibacter caeni]MCU7549168.1 YfiM family protein [Paraflavisolibacter caeni]
MNQFFLVILSFLSIQAASQNIIIKSDSSDENSSYHQTLPENTLKARQWFIGGISIAGYGGSLIYLNEAWYKGYEKTGFHTFNDSKEWLQMDKVGHAWTAYNTSRATTALWRWAGLSPKKSVLLGSLSGFSYLTVIELLDGYSAKWGWSWPDIAANFTGSSLFAAQELLWGEQRIQFKYLAHQKAYPLDLKTRANELFGERLPERLLKDYNAQTLWLSFNLKSFIKTNALPSWLNLSIGYGAEGLYGGVENRAFDKQGNMTFNRMDIQRYRQWYLSPDVDFTKIKTNRKGVRTVLAVLNIIKVPAPALVLSNGKVRGKLLSY